MFVMPDVALQRILKVGIDNLRENRTAFDDIFATYLEDDMGPDYGQTYVDNIWTWFTTTKVPVCQSFSLDVQKMPCYSIHLASTSEDESKAAMGDHFGDTEDGVNVGTGVFTVNIDIGVHANKNSDAVLWMYYILSYILFVEKPMAERLGLRLHTFNANDFDKDSRYINESIWSRWARIRCTTQNFWDGENNVLIDEVKFKVHKGRVGDEDDEETI